MNIEPQHYDDGETPPTLGARAAQKAIAAVLQELADGGAWATTVVVMFTGRDMPDGEPPDMVASNGVANPRELAQVVLGHAVMLLQAQGVKVGVHTMADPRLN